MSRIFGQGVSARDRTISVVSAAMDTSASDLSIVAGSKVIG
jgi:hypothetical protein